MHRTLNPDNTILIACSMMEDEIRRVLGKKQLTCPVIWMERGYHSSPDKLRAVLREQISLAEQRLRGSGTPLRNEGQEPPAILLAYGLCGNGTEGLQTQASLLAMPRFDDCINTLLCCGRRTCRAMEKAGVYYLTRGWTLDTGALLQSRQKLLERFGEKKTARIMDMMYDGYRKVAVIDDGCYDTAPVQQYAQECADLLHVDAETVPGGTYILEKLLTGNWDNDILVKQPGHPVEQEDFFYERI